MRAHYLTTKRRQTERCRAWLVPGTDTGNGRAKRRGEPSAADVRATFERDSWAHLKPAGVQS